MLGPTANAAEQEDNYTFGREDAARRGLIQQGSNGNAKSWDWNAPNAAATEAKPRLRIHVRPRQQSGDAGGAQTMCVRTCDGFAFPISASKANPTIAEYLCKTSCPGAPTQVFTRRPGAEMSTAVGMDKHKTPYAKLAAAGLFLKQSVAACSCRPPSAVTAGPLYNDPTLRKGDMIVLEGQKVVVFEGSHEGTHDADDFVELKRSRLVSQSIRRMVDERFASKYLAVADTRSGKKRGDKTKPLAAQAAAGIKSVSAAQAFAPEPRRPRVILPALFETLDASPPLDIASAAQAAPATPPSADKAPARN
jgi:hypothetical protein